MRLGDYSFEMGQIATRPIGEETGCLTLSRWILVSPVDLLSVFGVLLI